MSQTTIQRSKVAHIELSMESAKKMQRDSDRRVVSFRTDGVTRCSKCPPTTGCPTCVAINKGRVYAGLIRPREDPRPHPNNCLIPVMSGPVRGASATTKRHVPGPVITASVTRLGGGWRVGIATLEGDEIYRGKPTRSVTEAFAFARQGADCIRAGLEFEVEFLK